MRSERKYPVLLEEQVTRCDECGEDLAIVHAIDGRAAMTYRFVADLDVPDEELPPACHRNVVVHEPQAVGKFHRRPDRQTAVITEYDWPGRAHWPPLPDPPPGQLRLGAW
jgi:hypothetical protein